MMTRTIAFLRAINVGGHHPVKMDRLRQIFESLGFSDVETFIASGNVIFSTSVKNTTRPQSIIENGLKSALGFEVSTFLRTDLELTRIASFQPFSPSELKSAAAFNIAFLAAPISASQKRKVMALTTTIDNFAVHGREVYWLCLKSQSTSKFSNAVLEKTLGMPSTIRGVTTVAKIAKRIARDQRGF